jgi:hypothetical protein
MTTKKQNAGKQASSIDSDGMRIAKMDKQMEILYEEINDKKKQMVEDYKMLKKNVKENPYLQSALKVYDDYFEKEELQVKALEALLKSVPIADHPEIKREIKRIKEYLF